MKKIVQTLALASFFLFLHSCTSDDNVKEPEQPTFETKYYVSHIESTGFIKDYLHNDDGTYKIISVPEQGLTFDFTYTEDYKLTALNNAILVYKLGKVSETYPTIFDFKLDETNRLTSFDILLNNIPINTFAYTYTEDLLTSITIQEVGEKLEQTFSYNDRKQFISSLITPENIAFNYVYNEKNQMTKMTTGNLAIEIGHDDKKNPFSHLPFDMTTLIFDELEYIPFTYRFPNNINSLVSPNQEQYTVEYTYNKDNYPTKALVYEVLKNEKILYKEIHYTYLTEVIEEKK